MRSIILDAPRKQLYTGLFNTFYTCRSNINGNNNNLNIACAFSDHYNDLFIWVDYNIEDIDNLFEKVCKDSLYCLDHKHAITLSDIDNAMKKMKRGK